MNGAEQLRSITQDGWSPLYAASKEGHTDVVDLLVQAGADPNSRAQKVQFCCCGSRWLKPANLTTCLRTRQCQTVQNSTFLTWSKTYKPMVSDLPARPPS